MRPRFEVLPKESPPRFCVLDLVHGSAHDAARGASMDWLNGILAGFVIGVFASPPCETWSIARHNIIGDGRVVPVRSSDCPWGLPQLGLRQEQQITIGSFFDSCHIHAFDFDYFRWWLRYVGAPCLYRRSSCAKGCG